MPQKYLKRSVRKRIRGAAMVEALLSFFVIFLVLFGMLQVFYFFAGQYFADYAAIRGARSLTVGFRDYLVEREMRVNAIGGSGLLVEPALSSFSVSSELASEYSSGQFSVEKTLIQRYMVGARWIEYEYWFGRSSDSEKRVNTRLNSSFTHGNNMIHGKTEFSDYAFPDTYTKRLFFGDGISLKGDAQLRDHARTYLMD